MNTKIVLKLAPLAASLLTSPKVWAALPNFESRPETIQIAVQSTFPYEKIEEKHTPPPSRWNDVLSQAKTKDRSSSEILMGNAVPGDLYTSASPNTDFEKARSIILVQLLRIKQANEMGNNILMEKYWKEVFAQAQAPDLYEVGRPLVSEALAAGIKPYRDGKALTPTLFADLAMGALGMQNIQGTGASLILFRP